jgi:hypothetical protein
MYLTHAETQALLKEPYYTRPVTEHFVHYELYRSKLNSNVYTVRFNVKRNFDDETMKNFLLENVLKKFKLGTRLLASINYDVLLVDPNADPASYYLWRANSNLASFDLDTEELINLSYNTLYRFIQNAATVDLPSLSLFFATSNVLIDRLCAIVFCFAQA